MTYHAPPMPLPILQSHHEPTRDDLVRLFHRTEIDWARQIATEEEPLDFGTALVNPELPDCFDANMICDAALPEAMTPADVIRDADAFFSSRSGSCRMWVMNPSAPSEKTAPLIAHLLENGYTQGGYEIHHLASSPKIPIREDTGLTIIPARASYRHARQLATEAAAEGGRAQLADALMLHLEDGHTDALLALKDNVAIGLVTVLTVGELGCIENLWIAPNHRRQGVGLTLMSRALEICARSVFRHVFLGVDPTNTTAIALYAKFGFEKIGQLTNYQKR